MFKYLPFYLYYARFENTFLSAGDMFSLLSTIYWYVYQTNFISQGNQDKLKINVESKNSSENLNPQNTISLFLKP